MLPWALLPVLHLLHPAQAEVRALAGQPANYWAVLACFKHPKVFYSFTCFQFVFSLVYPAEAIDQWFENLQNYEATLVRQIDYLQLSTQDHHADPLI